MNCLIHLLGGMGKNTHKLFVYFSNIIFIILYNGFLYVLCKNPWDMDVEWDGESHKITIYGS